MLHSSELDSQITGGIQNRHVGVNSPSAPLSLLTIGFRWVKVICIHTFATTLWQMQGRFWFASGRWFKLGFHFMNMRCTQIDTNYFIWKEALILCLLFRVQNVFDRNQNWTFFVAAHWFQRGNIWLFWNIEVKKIHAKKDFVVLCEFILLGEMFQMALWVFCRCLE